MNATILPAFLIMTAAFQAHVCNKSSTSLLYFPVYFWLLRTLSNGDSNGDSNRHGHNPKTERFADDSGASRSETIPSNV